MRGKWQHRLNMRQGLDAPPATRRIARSAAPQHARNQPPMLGRPKSSSQPRRPPAHTAPRYQHSADSKTEGGRLDNGAKRGAEAHSPVLIGGAVGGQRMCSGGSPALVKPSGDGREQCVARAARQARAEETWPAGAPGSRPFAWRGNGLTAHCPIVAIQTPAANVGAARLRPKSPR